MSENYNTTIGVPKRVTERLRYLQLKLGHRPEETRKDRQMRLYNFVEILDMALALLEDDIRERGAHEAPR